LRDHARHHVEAVGKEFLQLQRCHVATPDGHVDRAVFGQIVVDLHLLPPSGIAAR
jgi:hypothetical protein